MWYSSKPLSATYAFMSCFRFRARSTPLRQTLVNGWSMAEATGSSWIMTVALHSLLGDATLRVQRRLETTWLYVRPTMVYSCSHFKCSPMAPEESPMAPKTDTSPSSISGA